MQQDKFRIDKIHISVTNPKRAIENIIEHALKGKGGYICVSNMRMIKYAGNNSSYADLMENSLMNLPDGRPLTWLAKLWNLKDSGCTDGPTTFRTMMNTPDQRLKHCLLGDTEDVLDVITKNVASEIVLTEALPFVNVEDFDYEGIAGRVKASGANIIWTAMRAPKQDEFNARLSKLVPNVVCLGVGRAFRLYLGMTMNAPKWAHKMGLAGIFTRRVSMFTALGFYFKTSFTLIKYATQILFKRLKGIKYYE